MYTIDVSTREGKAAAAALRACGAALAPTPRLYIIREDGTNIKQHTFDDAVPSLGTTIQNAHRIITSYATGTEVPAEIKAAVTKDAAAALIIAYAAAANVFDISDDIRTAVPLVEIRRGKKAYLLPQNYTPEQIEQAIAQA